MNVETTPLKAIRAKCLDCSGSSTQDVKLCPILSCPLYAFRFGRNPYKKPRVKDKENAKLAVNKEAG